MSIKLPKMLFRTKSEYKKFLTESIHSLMKDELTASVLYSLLSKVITRIDIAKEIQEHSKDEFNHFDKLIDYCTKHGLEVSIQLDEKIIENSPNTTKKICMYIQELENNAIEDYRVVSLVAKKYDDIETYEFMTEIMKEEIEHFDDISTVLEQTRDILTGNTVKSAHILEKED